MRKSTDAKLYDPHSQPRNYGSHQGASVEPNDSDELDGHRGLQRGLSARQVLMLAIAGTIGTGLFLGTGRSLAEGGPASMLICYGVVGLIVYITLLLLAEMATQYPVVGSFNAYTARFFSPAYGFALGWNFWFSAAVSMASDLIAVQLVLEFWAVENTWRISVILWVFLVGVNALHVSGYGELEYWLSSLKVVAVVVFVIVGTFVNLGLNSEHTFIGFSNWRIPGAPFVGGFGGFVSVFVAASFAYSGTESLGITAGETENPSKNMPKVIKLIFWRIIIFYILTILVIGLNVPWDYPNLHNRSITTSPFTIVFVSAGSSAAASFMNAVILTSAVSAGNHALFIGTRVLYGLSVSTPRHAPKIFSWTTSSGAPIPALLVTSSVSALCFFSSFIGSGKLWGWLQNIIGVCAQIAWLSIGLSSWRFRQAWVRQGRSLKELKYHASWTWPWGPPFVIISVSLLIIVQGWSSVIPVFSMAKFCSFYAEPPIIVAMAVAWTLLQTPPTQATVGLGPSEPLLSESRPATSLIKRTFYLHDLVDIDTVDLYLDEYVEGAQGDADADDEVTKRLNGTIGSLSKVYYWLM